MEFSDLAGKNTNYMAMCQSPEGRIYLATDWGNIVTFDPASYQKIEKGALPKVKKVHVHRLLYADGYVWLSTWLNGAIRYNPRTDTYDQYAYQPENKTRTLSHWDVYQIVPMENGRLLAATWNGYTLLLPEKEDSTRYVTNVYNNTASQLHRNLETRMISAYYDPEGILWIGTQGGGIYVSDLRKQFYQRFHQETHNEICGMAADRKNHIWLASFHKGILKSAEPFDPSGELSFERIPAGASSTVLSVATDKNGDLWFGNNQSELIWYHSDNESFTVFPIRISDQPDWTGSVWYIVCDTRNRVWLGTTNGLLLFDPQTRNFTHYPVFPGTIRAMAEVPGECLWLGTTHGLKKLIFQDGTIGSGFEKKANIPARDTRSLFASTDGNLYIGYADGFGIMKIGTDSIGDFYTTHNGLSNNFIGCISEDSQGHLWLGSNSSICRYSKHQKLFYNYYISGNNRSVFYRNGYLFWGNNKNLTYFRPEDVIRDQPEANKVVITQLEVDNKQVRIGQKINDQVILEEGIPYTKGVTLNASNNNFSLMFSNLTYSEELQKYSYRLTPVQSEWSVAGDGERISYANLPAGNYLFEVRSIFPGGSNGDPSMLALKILPYWYETAWFRLLVVVFIVWGVYALMRRIKKEQIRLTLEERLKHELFVSNLEREKEKQISRERENFFTNVSHELRTPLALILSPLQEVLQTERLSETIHNKLSLVYNNAVSLSTLVNQLLYIQKIEAGMVQLCLSKVEIVGLVRKVMASFQPMAEMKNTEYVLDSGIFSIQPDRNVPFHPAVETI